MNSYGLRRKLVYFLLNIFQPLIRWKERNAVRVLAYHSILNVPNFENHLKYLKDYYHIISIYEIDDYVNKGKPLPPYSVLVTFDDGDISLYKEGLPLFIKYDIPVLVFIITSLIDTQNPFWWNIVQEYYVQRGEGYLSRGIINKLKVSTNKERLFFLDQIVKEGLCKQQDQLSSAQLDEMNQHNVCIGNHSDTHPMMDKLSDQEIKEEFSKANQFFQKRGMDGYKWFAFPNGNYDRRQEFLLEEAEISLAFLFDHKLNKKRIHPLRVSRIRVNTYDPMPEFKVRLSGLHSFLMAR